MTKKRKINNSYFINNCEKVSVIHLSHKHANEKNELLELPSLDYHIHILSFYDKSNGYCGSILLDTDDLITIPLQNRDVDLVLEETLLELSKLFIDQINNLLSQNISPDILKQNQLKIFTKSSNELWDYFNEIKADTYIRDIQRFNECVNTDKSTVKLDIAIGFKSQVKPDEIYRNTEIWITEDRKVKVPINA